jgi:hypothetical protein
MRAATGESALAGCGLDPAEPCGTRSPSVAIISLSVTGTPSIVLSGALSAQRRVEACAWRIERVERIHMRLPACNVRQYILDVVHRREGFSGEARGNFPRTEIVQLCHGRLARRSSKCWFYRRPMALTEPLQRQ